jgi:hypothetical protein
VKLEIREGKPYLFNDEGRELLDRARKVTLTWDVSKVLMLDVEIVAHEITVEDISGFGVKLAAVCPSCGHRILAEKDTR